MIPSVQFQSCNDSLTTAIHKDYLEKFDMPIVSSLNSDDDIQLSDQSTTNNINTSSTSAIIPNATNTATVTAIAASAAQFDSDQILMHQIEFSDSDIAISQDCHSIELETSDEMIATCDDTAQNIINYTIIGNGLILIEGPPMDFDDETKDSGNNLRALKGIDLMVTVKNDNNDNENDCDDGEHHHNHHHHHTRQIGTMNAEEDEEIEEIENEACEEFHCELDEMSVVKPEENFDKCEVKEKMAKPNVSTQTRTSTTVNQYQRPGVAANKSNDDDDNNNDDDDDDGGGDGDDDDESSSEHELTNLGWLIDLKNLAQWPVESNNSTSNRKNSNTNSHSALANGITNCIMNDIDDEQHTPAPVISEKDLSEERFKKFTIQVKQSQKNYAERERIYKMDPLEKPPFNYAQIIAMAMMDRGRMTLKDICKWIQEHFAYFRFNKNWNNSIRHNLSLHFCFTKIARDKAEKGKGGYWELSMNATKSEKKRVRNRRKHRDDGGRVSQSHRNRLPPRRNIQRSSTSSGTSIKQALDNSTKLKSTPTSSVATNDSCNVSSASDGSSSMCSGNGINDDTKNMWSELHGITNTHFMQSLHNSVHHEQLEHELISDVITNDLVIINGSDLDQSSNDMIRCNFDKSNSQTIDRYFVDHESHKQHLPGANGNALVESSITAAILNDSSNETFIKGGLDQQTNLLSSATIATAASTSNVIVEPMPYSLSHMDTVIDIDHEFGNLVNMADPELTVDGFFDYGSW